MTTTGQRIKKLRLLKDIKQIELAESVGCSKQTIYKYENDIVTNIPYDKIIDIARVLETSEAYLMGWEEAVPLYSNITPIKKRSLPMLGEIACGEPVFANQQHNTYVEADSNINADFCLHCKGDSMIGDGINDGDIIFIRKQDSVENGEIACVIIDDEATLKHVYMSDSNITLIASNTNYAPMVYGEHDAGTIKILGKAVALSRIL